MEELNEELLDEVTGGGFYDFIKNFGSDNSEEATLWPFKTEEEPEITNMVKRRR